MSPYLSVFKRKTVREFVCAAIVCSLLVVSAPFMLAADKSYKIEQVVSDGKDSKETDAVLTIKENSFVVMPDKEKFKSSSKEFSYADIKVADYSYSKKPMLSVGGAIAAALLVGIIALPFLFLKKKNHWLSVQTEKEYVVMKLDNNNFRQIVAEMETHNVKVNTVKEEDEKKKDDK